MSDAAMFSQQAVGTLCVFLRRCLVIEERHSFESAVYKKYTSRLLSVWL